MSAASRSISWSWKAGPRAYGAGSCRARVWPDVFSNAIDPGWVPTKMGGAAATDDLEMGYLTQTWLSVSNDAAATVSGGYWSAHDIGHATTATAILEGT